MKRSEFKESIRNEIIDILEEASKEDVENQKAYNAELEKTAKLVKDAGLDEGNDRDYRDDGYVDKRDVDDTTNLYVHNDPESMAFENNNPVVAKGDGIEITQDEMDKLHKDGKVKLKNGSVLFYVKETVDEHHGDDFPKGLLKKSVDKFLDDLKKKSEKDYDKVEDIMKKHFNVDEASMTGTGASFTAGTGAAYATPYAFKKKRKDD